MLGECTPQWPKRTTETSPLRGLKDNVDYVVAMNSFFI